MPIQETGTYPDRPLSKRYQDLPPQTQGLLQRWNYGGIYPPELSASDALPSMSFMIADIKLPSEGHAKILELGGLGSHLDAYPDGPATVANRIYQILGSIGTPVRVITPFTMADALAAIGGGPSGVARTLIGADLVSANNKYDIRFPEDSRYQQKLEARNAGVVKPLADIRDAKAIVWTHQAQEALGNMDTGRFVLINPPEIAALVDDKAATQQFFEEHGLADVRPASWVIPPTCTRENVEKMIASAEDIDRFVVKTVGFSGGRGVEVLTKEDVVNRLGYLLASQHKTDDPNEPDFYLTNTLAYGGNLVLEEYIPGIPIEANGKHYDATMRIAMVTIVNNGKLTIVPVAAYYKLPTQPLNEGWTTESVVSSVLGRDESSARVADEDFQRAFASVTKALPHIVQLAHTAPRVAKEPKPIEPIYMRSHFEGQPAENPQVGQEYVMFGRRVRFIGMKRQSNGIEGFEVQYLDKPGSRDDYRRGQSENEVEFYGDWQLHKLYLLPQEETEEL